MRIHVFFQVFLEPLKKLVGSTEAPSLLLSSCSNQSQRSRLHHLGFALGISQWIEDFQSGLSYKKQEDDNMDVQHFGLYKDKEHKRPIAVVKPVSSSNETISRQSEVTALSSRPRAFRVSKLRRGLSTSNEARAQVPPSKRLEGLWGRE